MATRNGSTPHRSMPRRFGHAIATAHTAPLIATLFITFGGPAASAQMPDSVSLENRMWIAAKMLSVVESHFAHWEAVPDLDLDAAFREYAAQAAAAEDRATFSLASMAFLARLRNGHTGFFDTPLMQSRGAPLGFALMETDGGWVVSRSRLESLEVGADVRTIDGRPVADYVAELLPYIPASSDREAVRKVWTQGAMLWPATFTLGLAGGESFEIRRGQQSLLPVAPRRFEAGRLDDDVAYLRIPSFGAPAMEDSAIAFIERNADAPALIIDVRANGGGTTPTRLIEALMDRPYRGFGFASAIDVGLYSAYNRIGQIMPAGSLDDYTRGYIDAFDGFDRPLLVFPGELTPPGQPKYTGPVVILIDAACASACEDFVLPFKSSGRGTLIGDATSGSTGQPYLFDFGNGMSFRVSARRVYMPDGSQFEGVGIRPDEEVQPTIEDLRSDRDVVLERAMAIVR